MLEHFALHYHSKTSKTFDVKGRYIRYVSYHLWCCIGTEYLHRCLAHIINLVTQAIILTRSKAKYYDGHSQDDMEPEDLGATERDEIGLIQSICVKVGLELACFLVINLLLYRHAPPLCIKDYSKPSNGVAIWFKLTVTCARREQGVRGDRRLSVDTKWPRRVLVT